MNRSIRVAAGLLIALPVLAAAQAIGPGFELERSGRYADAANVYLTTIHTDPVNIPALLGLERTLFVLNRMPELLPLVQAARARLPDNVALRSLAPATGAGGARKTPGQRRVAQSRAAGVRRAQRAGLCRGYRAPLGRHRAAQRDALSRMGARAGRSSDVRGCATGLPCGPAGPARSGGRTAGGGRRRGGPARSPSPPGSTPPPRASSPT